MNKRITKKEYSLLKSAVRRVFSRSELRRKIVENSRIDHFDESRPRVKKWSVCTICHLPTPSYEIQIDHHQPVIRVTESAALLSVDQFIDRVWCVEKNLKPVCITCHKAKTKTENAKRKKHRKSRK